MGKIRIPVAAPKISGNEIEYVSDCIRSGWISSRGGYVEKFEHQFAEFCECKHGVASNSGTTALHLALAALRIGPGDEVIIPTFTMIATPNTVSYTGAKPVLVDSELDTWNMDVSKIEENLTEKTKAIMVMHTYGHPVDMDPILELARSRQIAVIEDAAEAHGAEYKGKKVGSLGDVGCFSFYANKIITCGEGGMLVTNNEEIAERSAWLRGHAFGRGGKHFYHEEIGFGYRMSALQAAFGLAQLENIDDLISNRRRNGILYKQLLSEMGSQGKVTLQPEASWAKNVYWMSSVLLQDSLGHPRSEFMETLEKDGIETRTFFYPVHAQPAYQNSMTKKRFEVADDISRKGVNLPSGNDLNTEEVQYICDSIKRHFG